MFEDDEFFLLAFNLYHMGIGVVNLEYCRASGRTLKSGVNTSVVCGCNTWQVGLCVRCDTWLIKVSGSIG